MFRGLSALLGAVAATFVLASCGGDDAPDTDGDLRAKELAAKLPESGDIPGATAVDVAAAKEAAGLPEDADPTDLGETPEDVRFASSTFSAFFSLSALVENPVRSAMDHSLITAYAGNLDYTSEDTVTLVSTSQDFEDIATALEDEGWERDGDVLTGDSDEQGLTYSAVAAGDGFLVLGYSADAVESVASGEAQPSEAGDVSAIEDLDAPVVGAVVPRGVEGLDCVTLVAYEDFVNGDAELQITVDGQADEESLSKQIRQDSESAGFTFDSAQAEGETLTVVLKGRDAEGIANNPSLLIGTGFDETGPLLYDCG